MRDKNRKKLFKFLKNTEGNVFLLQEMYSTPEDKQEWELQWNEKIFFQHGDRCSKGVAILLNKCRELDVKVLYKDQEGRIIIIELESEQYQFAIANIYAPNIDNPAFFVQTFTEIEKSDMADKIIGRDFNLTLNPEVDRKNCKEAHKQSRQKVLDYMQTGNMCDVWRIYNSDVHHFTWSRKRNKHSHEILAVRLDFLLISDNLTNCVESTALKPGYNTDHSMVELELQSGIGKRGKGFWKLNTSLLKVKQFTNGAIEVIRKAGHKHANSTPDLKWEMIKCEFNNYSVGYAVARNKIKCENFQMLQEKLNFLEHCDKRGFEDEVEAEIAETKAWRELMLQQQVQSHILHSKTKWHLYGERNSKFFFSLMKSRYNHKTMRKIKTDTGKLITDPKQILQEQAKYYGRLYCKNQDVQFMVWNVNGTKITDEQRAFLDMHITLDEITLVMKHFALDKTLGCDGWSVEIYLKLWEHIKDYYFEALQYGIKHKKLHISVRRGVLSLILKKDRCPLVLKNWRPLTMLSMDYKLFSKVLDNRLKNGTQ